MSDPQRLIGGAGTSEFETSILSSWGARQPGAEARARTLVAVGAASALGAGVVAGTASMAPKAAAASSLLLKWLGLGVALATTAGAVGYAVHASSLAHGEAAQAMVTISRPVSPQVSRPVSPAPVVAWQPAAAVPPPQSPEIETPPAVSAPQAGVPAASPPARVAAAPTQAGSTLDDEVYTIDQARRAVMAGSAGAALGLVDAYDARYPGGALAQESTEVRIEALYRLGKRPLADKLATRFLAAHPTSPYAREIRALLVSPPQVGVPPVSPSP